MAKIQTGDFYCLKLATVSTLCWSNLGENFGFDVVGQLQQDVVSFTFVSFVPE